MSESRPEADDRGYHSLAGTIRAVGKRLDAALAGTAGLGDSLTIGEIRERRVKEALGPFVPERYLVTTGLVVNLDGRVSRQQDLLLVDTHFAPFFERAAEMSVVPVQAVPAALQVKSKGSAGEVARAVENLASVKRLMPRGERHGITVTTRMVSSATGPFTGIICLTKTGSEEAIFDAYVEANRQLDPYCRTNALLLANESVGLWSPDATTGLAIWEPEKAASCMLVRAGELSTGLFLARLLDFLGLYPPPEFNMQDYAIRAIVHSGIAALDTIKRDL